MSLNGKRAREQALRVVVVGLIGEQCSQLRRLLFGCDVKLTVLRPEHLLRRRRIAPDLVVFTRFVKHKHSRHARQMTHAPIVVVDRGCAVAVANAIASHLGIRLSAA